MYTNLLLVRNQTIFFQYYVTWIPPKTSIACLASLEQNSLAWLQNLQAQDYQTWLSLHTILNIFASLTSVDFTTKEAYKILNTWLHYKVLTYASFKFAVALE